MNRRTAMVLISIPMMGLISAASGAIAQQRTLEEQVVGTWTLVSAVIQRDGKTIEPFGSNPLGYMMFSADGHFSVNFVRADRPIFASNNRETGTVEENRAAVQGNISAFGRYKIEPDGSLTSRLSAVTFPTGTGRLRNGRLRSVAAR